MKTNKWSTAENNSPPPDQLFPSARYFQIHFQFLQEIIGDLRVQVEKANRQIELPNCRSNYAFNNPPTTLHKTIMAKRRKTVSSVDKRMPKMR